MTTRSKKRLAFLFVTLVLVGGLGLGAVALRRSQRDRSLEQSLRDGLAAYEAKNYDVALEKLAYYVGRRDSDGPAVLALAKTRWKIPTGNSEYLLSAARYAQEAAKRMPTDPAPLEMLLAVYQELSYLTERIETAERLLALNPKHLGALRARAECQILKNSKDHAMAAADAWAAVAPDDTDAHAAVIQAKRLAGRPNEEIADYLTSIVTRHPNDFRFAVFQAAIELDVLNNNAAAIAAIKRSLELPQTDARSISSLVMLLDNYRLEEIDESLKGGADRLLAVMPADKALAAEFAAIGAKREFKLMLPPQTANWLAPIVAAGDAAPDSAIGLILFLTSGDDAVVKAPSELHERLKNRSGPAAEGWQHVLDAQRALAASDAPEARRHLIKAAGLDPSNDVILYLLAQADAQLGEWRRASSSLESLATADPSWAVARRSLVTLLLRANQVYDALIQANAAFKARPRVGEAYRLGEASVRVAEISSDPQAMKVAEDFVRQFGKEQVGDPVVAALLARLHARAGRGEEAVTSARDVLSAKADVPSDSFVSLADAVRAFDAKLATALLERARLASPQDPDVALAAADDRALTDPKAAEAILTDLADSQQGPAKQATLRRLAVFLDHREDPRAIDRLRQIAADHPKDATAQTLLLDSLTAWKDEATIAAAIKRYRDICGDDSTLWRTFEARRQMIFKPAADYASRAVTLLVPVVNAEPQNAPALALLAEANRILGDNGKSIEYLSRAVESNPADPTFYPPLINGLDRLGRRVEADRRLDTLVALANVSLDVRRQRAQLLAERERWADAAADYEVLVRAGDAQDRLSYAMVLSRAGKNDQASAIFDEIVKTPNPDARTLAAAADFAAMQGQVDQGAALLARLPASVPAADRLAAQAGYLERNHRVDAAQKMYEDAAKTGDPDRAADLALFYLRHGMGDLAGATAADALKTAPDHKRLLALANVARVRQGGTLAPGALGATLASLMTNEDPKAMEQWLSALTLLESTPPNRERYLSEINALTRLYPRFYPGWHTLSLALLEVGDADGAVKAARAALVAMPDQVRAARLATQVLAACGKMDEAADAAAAWQRLSTADPFDADMEFARLQLERKKVAEAAALVSKWKDRVLAEADRTPLYLETYCHVLMKTNGVAEAHDLLLGKLKQASSWLAVFLRVASGSQADVATSRAWGRDAAALPLDAPAQVMLGNFWHDLASRHGSAEDLAQAIAVLTSIKTSDKAVQRDAALLLASCYQARNETREAEMQYRKVIELAPADALALNNLAYLLLTYGGSLDEAATFAQRGVAESEKQTLAAAFRASVLDTLGQIQIRQKRGVDAIATYDKATRLNPNDVSLWVGLAEGQALNNQLSEARVTMGRIDGLLNSAPTPDTSLNPRVNVLRERLGMPSSKRTNG